MGALEEMTRAEKEAVAAQMYPERAADFREIYEADNAWEGHREFSRTLTDEQVEHFSAAMRVVATLAPQRLTEMWRVARYGA